MPGFATSACQMEIGSGSRNGDGSNSQVAACHSSNRLVSTSAAGGFCSQGGKLSVLMLEDSMTFEYLPHAACVRGEFRAFTDRQRARPREVDVDDLDDPPGPGRHDAHAVGEQDRFGDAVGHEDDGLA